jgi:anti-sigma B factor antagonist
MSLHERVSEDPQQYRPDGVASMTSAALPDPFGVEIRPDRERVIVAPRGELDLETVGQLAEAIDGVVDSGFRDVVLDLRRLGFIDSTGLHLVVAQARRSDATIRVIDGTDPIARVFDLSGIRDAIPFLTPSEVRALP